MDSILAGLSNSFPIKLGEFFDLEAVRNTALQCSCNQSSFLQVYKAFRYSANDEKSTSVKSLRRSSELLLKNKEQLQQALQLVKEFCSICSCYTNDVKESKVKELSCSLFNWRKLKGLKDLLSLLEENQDLVTQLYNEHYLDIRFLKDIGLVPTFSGEYKLRDLGFDSIKSKIQLEELLLFLSQEQLWRPSLAQETVAPLNHDGKNLKPKAVSYLRLKAVFEQLEKGLNQVDVELKRSWNLVRGKNKRKRLVQIPIIVPSACTDAMRNLVEAGIVLQNSSEYQKSLKHFESVQQMMASGDPSFKYSYMAQVEVEIYLDLMVGYSYKCLGEDYSWLLCWSNAKDSAVRAFGMHSTIVAMTYEKVGSVYYHLGNLSLAKQLFQDASGIYSERLGSDHVDTVTSMVNYACCLPVWEAKKYAREQLLTFKRSEKLFREILGLTHVRTQTVLWNLKR